MTRYYNKNRRESTVASDNKIHLAYSEVIREIGEISAHVSRSEIYRRVSEKVHMCAKTVANVLNHTEYQGTRWKA